MLRTMRTLKIERLILSGILTKVNILCKRKTLFKFLLLVMAVVVMV